MTDEFDDGDDEFPTSGGRVPPHNLDAERAMLGSMLLTPAAIDDIHHLVTPDDFYAPGHQVLYSALLDMWRSGASIDTVTVGERLDADDTADVVGGTSALVELQSTTPAATNAASYAKVIVEASVARRAIGVAASIQERAFNRDDPGALIEDAMVDLRFLVDEATSDTPDLVALSDFASAEKPMSPWLIQGLLRRGWRTLVVAEEGAGKTTLLRQVAIAAAAGIHPFTLRRIDPIRCLVIDLENPDDSVLEVCRPILRLADHANPTWDRNRCQLWHDESGLNLRARADRARFIAAVQQARPDVVLVGPLYKMTHRGSDSYEEDAKELQQFLDGVRIRYGFALLIEHHMPQDRTVERPEGSSLWRRWPELGLMLMLKKGTATEYALRRFRRDRVMNSWPTIIHRDVLPVGHGRHTGRWPWRLEGDLPDDDDLADPGPADRPRLPYED